MTGTNFITEVVKFYLKSHISTKLPSTLILSSLSENVTESVTMLKYEMVNLNSEYRSVLKIRGVQNQMNEGSPLILIIHRI